MKIETDNLIDIMYAGNFTKLAIQDLPNRTILAATNEKTLQMNLRIIVKVPGSYHAYYSSDSHLKIKMM